MQSIVELIRKWNIPYITKTILVILDIIIINFSAFLALALRYNMHIAAIPEKYGNTVQEICIINTLLTLCIFVGFRLYHSLWRYASIRELLNVVEACLASTLVSALIIIVLGKPIFRSYYIIYAVGLLIFTCMTRFAYRLARMVYRSRLHGDKMRNTMIIGAGEACTVVMNELSMSDMLDARICCIIDDDKKKHGTFIHGVKIVGGRDQIINYAKKYDINEIIIALPSAKKSEVRKIIAICQEYDRCELKILPGVYQLVTGDITVEKIRNVEIEDLLGREAIKITLDKLSRKLKSKTALVTGGGGSIGSELCRQLAANGVDKLVIFDIYENNAYEIEQELKRDYKDLEIHVLIGSVRDKNKLDSVFKEHQPNMVYHAAAHKHVPLMETSPHEAVKNNVFGTLNVVQMSDAYKVERFVLISTDKAVNPTNIMGATKRIGEMIVQTYSRRSETNFVAVRFGNVLGSNGSVIPLFKKQLEHGGPITVTSPDVIRYFMTIREAVSLVIQAGMKAGQGQIYVLDMGEPVKIDDLAKNLIKLSGHTLGVDMEIEYTGLRPGEKMYEELLMSEEGLKATDNDKIFIGNPIGFDDQKFIEDLCSLEISSKDEYTEIKEIVRDMVPTYKCADIK